MINKIKQDIHNYRAAIIISILYIFLMQMFFKNLCPIKIFTGFSCPGCGLTHASVYLLTGKFHEAIHANYSVFFWWLFLISFVIDRYIIKLKIKPIPYMLILASIITLLRYIIIIAQFLNK